MKKEAEQLFKIKEDLEKKKQEKMRLEGALSSVMEELKKEGIKTTMDLKKELDKMEKKLNDLEDKFKKGVDELNQNYKW